MIPVTGRRTVFVCACFISAIARADIIISDGPSSSAASSSSLSSSSGRHNIITTDGPSVMPYQYPPKIIVSNGPAQPFYASYLHPSKVVVSDGPGSSTPDPQESTLAPAITGNFLPSGSELSSRSKIEASGHRTRAAAIGQSFYIYSDKQDPLNHSTLTGWLGDYKDLHIDDGNTNNPHSGKTCIQISYTGKNFDRNGWTGLSWQFPSKKSADKPGSVNLTGRKRLTFWARGEKGTEVISEFKMGGTTMGPYNDSSSVGTGTVQLTTEWKKYSMDLANLDLSHIISGFSWYASRSDNPNGMTFYLDDIRYE